jgi:hypothetical protein
MRAIWMGIHPRPEGTRILATQGPDETLHKARLRPDVQHPRALAALLEAVALWQGRPVRAALAVDASSPGCATSLWPDSPLGGDATPLYTLEPVAAHRRRRRRDDLDGLGDFRDLRQLLLFEVAR